MASKPLVSHLAPGLAIGAAALILIFSALILSPAVADEFDVLVALEGAAPLNDQWQVCAAEFVRPRLRSKQSPARLAQNAFESCTAEEGKFQRFLVEEIGKKSADSVIGLLREKYQSDLASAIRELRRRD